MLCGRGRWFRSRNIFRSITLRTRRDNIYDMMLQIVSGGSGCSRINKTVCVCVCVGRTEVFVCAEATRVIDVFRTADRVQVCVSVSAILHVHNSISYAYCMSASGEYN